MRRSMVATTARGAEVAGMNSKHVISYHLSAQVAGRATLRYMADVYNTVL